MIHTVVIEPYICSAGPETQAVTHTDGGVKCAVQVGSVTNREIMVCQGEMGKIERNLEI